MKVSKKLAKNLKRNFLTALIGITLILACFAIAKQTDYSINLAKLSESEQVSETMQIAEASDTSTPITNFDFGNAKIVGGSSHFVAIDKNGDIYSWGDNSNNQIFSENTTDVVEPTKMEWENVIDVAAGNKFTLILKEDGTVWARGYNYYGQLGNNSTSKSKDFIQVMNSDGSRRIKKYKIYFCCI